MKPKIKASELSWKQQFKCYIRVKFLYIKIIHCIFLVNSFDSFHLPGYIGDSFMPLVSDSKLTENSWQIGRFKT